MGVGRVESQFRLKPTGAGTWLKSVQIKTVLNHRGASGIESLIHMELPRRLRDGHQSLIPVQVGDGGSTEFIDVTKMPRGRHR